jgi:hypothetical protein
MQRMKSVRIAAVLFAFSKPFLIEGNSVTIRNQSSGFRVSGSELMLKCLRKTRTDEVMSGHDIE